MECLSTLRRNLAPSLQRGWHHRADGYLVRKKHIHSSGNAAYFCYHKRLKVLLKSGAVNDKNWLDEALMKATGCGETKCVKFLIAQNADGEKP